MYSVHVCVQMNVCECVVCMCECVCVNVVCVNVVCMGLHWLLMVATCKLFCAAVCYTVYKLAQ